MKKQDILSILRLLLAPVLVILLGILLLFNPDSASVLISKLLGWLLLILAVGFGIAALVSERKAGKIIAALALFAAGTVLTRNPLLLASFIGRVVGLLLVIDGVQDMFSARRQAVRFLMPLIVTIIGAVLVLMPMTTSRLVFSLCGLVVLIVGVLILLDRLRHRRLPGGDSDRNIIDAL